MQFDIDDDEYSNISYVAANKIGSQQSTFDCGVCGGANKYRDVDSDEDNGEDIYAVDDEELYYASITAPKRSETLATSMVATEATKPVVPLMATQFKPLSALLGSKVEPKEIKELRCHYDERKKRKNREHKDEDDDMMQSLQSLQSLQYMQPFGKTIPNSYIPIKPQDFKAPTLPELTPLLAKSLIPVTIANAETPVTTALPKLRPLEMMQFQNAPRLSSVGNRSGDLFFGALNLSPLWATGLSMQGAVTKVDVAQSYADEFQCPTAYVAKHRPDLHALWVKYDVKISAEPSLVLLPSQKALKEAVESYSRNVNGDMLIQQYLNHLIIPAASFESAMQKVPIGAPAVVSLDTQATGHSIIINRNVNNDLAILKSLGNNHSIPLTPVPCRSVFDLPDNADIYPMTIPLTESRNNNPIIVTATPKSQDLFLTYLIELAKEGHLSTLSLAKLEEQNSMSEFVSLGGTLKFLNTLCNEMKVSTTASPMKTDATVGANSTPLAELSVDRRDLLNVLLCDINAVYLPLKTKEVTPRVQQFLVALKKHMSDVTQLQPFLAQLIQTVSAIEQKIIV